MTVRANRRIDASTSTYRMPAPVKLYAFAGSSFVAGIAGVDVRTAEACRAAVAEAAERLDGLEIFAHAVGRNVRLPVAELGDDDWFGTLTLNLSTAYWLGQTAGKVMCERRYGPMVFMSSVSGLLAHKHHGPYAASKGGLNQLLRVMAREWAPSGGGTSRPT
jgi:gluconate 5-dehydrogenase